MVDPQPTIRLSATGSVPLPERQKRTETDTNPSCLIFMVPQGPAALNCGNYVFSRGERAVLAGPWRAMKRRGGASVSRFSVRNGRFSMARRGSFAFGCGSIQRGGTLGIHVLAVSPDGILLDMVHDAGEMRGWVDPSFSLLGIRIYDF